LGAKRTVEARATRGREDGGESVTMGKRSIRKPQWGMERDWRASDICGFIISYSEGGEEGSKNVASGVRA
jgi:hypothetical protein